MGKKVIDHECDVCGKKQNTRNSHKRHKRIKHGRRNEHKVNKMEEHQCGDEKKAEQKEECCAEGKGLKSAVESKEEADIGGSGERRRSKTKREKEALREVSPACDYERM